MDEDEIDEVCHMPKMMVGSKTLHTDGLYPSLVARQQRPQMLDWLSVVAQ